MFLIFLLLFGSSQKEGERLPNKTVQSKKLRSIQTIKSTEPTLVLNNRTLPNVRRPWAVLNALRNIKEKMG
jgi:hypothetical protein